MFALKKFLTVWLMPLPFCLVLLVVGLWWVCSSKHLQLGRFFLMCGVLFLLAFSNRFVSSWLIRPLETSYPAVADYAPGDAVPSDLAECQAVVVLGGGHGDVNGFSALAKLSSASRARLTEGVRLARLLPSARLIVTGGGATGQPTHAEIQAQAAISLGVDPKRIVRIETARDTEEEAQALTKIIGNERFALVSSAWHLRRATALMRNQGLKPLPCPCDFTVRPGAQRSISDFLWDTESLGRSTWAVYERLGFLWSRGRGKI